MHGAKIRIMIRALNVIKICTNIFISIDFIQNLERKVNKYAYLMFIGPYIILIVE